MFKSAYNVLSFVWALISKWSFALRNITVNNYHNNYLITLKTNYNNSSGNGFIPFFLRTQYQSFLLVACQWCGSHIYSVSTSSLPLSSSPLMLRICCGVSTAIRIFILTAFRYSCNFLDSDFTLESGVLSGLFASSFWQHYCSVLGECYFPVLKWYAYKELRFKNNTVVYLYFQPGV